MRRILFLAVSAVLLAGCSDGNAMSKYVVKASELGGDFVYTELDDEARGSGVLGNPGALDIATVFEGDEGVTAGYVAAFSRPNATEAPVIQSVGLRFRDATLAVGFAHDNFGCSEAVWIFQKGNVLLAVQTIGAYIAAGDEQAVHDAARTGALALQQRTGATDLCADGGALDEAH